MIEIFAKIVKGFYRKNDPSCLTGIYIVSVRIFVNSEAVIRRCSVKKVFLKISQNSQENTCARVSFLTKLQASVCNFIKKETLAQVYFQTLNEFCRINNAIL